MIQKKIPYEEWRAENHKIIHADVLHTPKGVFDTSTRCLECGLPFDPHEKTHISKYAPQLSIELGVSLVVADRIIASGRFTEKSYNKPLL